VVTFNDATIQSTFEISRVFSRANGVEVSLENNTSVVVTEVTGSTQPMLSITRTFDGQLEIQLEGVAGKTRKRVALELVVDLERACESGTGARARDLRDRGVISAEDFEREKAKVLAA
jgi:hypothetical protein